MGGKGETREVEVELVDGSVVLIRPVTPADADLLRAGFEKLSPESRHRRFFAAMTRLTDSMVAYLTDVDHHDHEALLAIDLRSGEATGVARYVREAGTSDAEVAVTVADDWQGRGLGTALLELLSDRGRAEGVRRFKAIVLAYNRPMRDVLAGLGQAKLTGSIGETIELLLDLPEDGLGGELHEALRVAAKEPLHLVLPPTPHDPVHRLELAPEEDPQPPPAA